MKNRYGIIVIFVLTLPWRAVAQDFHFTQFYNTPFEMNPARTGIFDGDHRFTGIYRNQWNSVTIPYRSYAVAYDTRANSRWGAGVSLLHDDAGDGILQTLKADLAISYIINAGGDSVNFISIGIRNGVTQNSIDFSRFTFDSQFDGDVYVPGSPTFETFGASSFSFFDLSAGINWLHRFEQNGPYIQGGLALFHVNRPARSFYESDEKLPSRFVTQLNGRWLLSERTSVLPSLLFMRQGPFSELNGGGLLRYRWTESVLVDHAVYLGAFLREADAINVAAGFDYKNFTAGFSYDINFSGLETASNNKGGFEMSLIYLIRKVKPVNPYKAACPVY